MLNDRDAPHEESGLFRSRASRLFSSFGPGTAPRIGRSGALSYWKGPTAAPEADAEAGALADASEISPVWVFSLGPKRLTGSSQWPDVAFRIWNCRLPGDGLISTPPLPKNHSWPVLHLMRASFRSRLWMPMSPGMFDCSKQGALKISSY